MQGGERMQIEHIGEAALMRSETCTSHPLRAAHAGVAAAVGPQMATEGDV